MLFQKCHKNCRKITHNYRKFFAAALSATVLAGLSVSLPLTAEASGDDSTTGEAIPSYAPGRVIIQLAESCRTMTSALADIELGIDFISMQLLNPSAGIADTYDTGSIQANSITGTQNNVLLLILEDDQSEDAVEEAIKLLSVNPLIEIAEPDYYYELADGNDYRYITAATPNDPMYGRQYGLARINAQGAWDYATGSKRVAIGVLDSGIDGTHPDLKDNLWVNPKPNQNGYINDIHGYNFADEKGGIPYDLNGHGTRVSGVAGAKGNNGIGIAGVNWNVSIAWLAITNGDANTAQTSYIVSALNYANNHNIPVTINSYANFTYSQTLHNAIRNYKGLFVAAAGNHSRNIDIAPVYPAAYDCPNILSVAATGSNDELTNFSNFGATNVHIAAPGRNIATTDKGGKYTTSVDGTSYACPYVAGVAALMLDVNPSLSTAELRQILLSTVRNSPGLGDYGNFGIVDAAAAISKAKNTRPPDTEAVTAFVTRFYKNVLGRNPDARGLELWVTRLINRERKGAEIAYEFFGCTEFLTKKPKLSNARYVELLYNTMLGRKPDANGLKTWTEYLDKGNRRENLVARFIGSNEFAELCANTGIAVGDPTPPANVNVRSFVWMFYDKCLNRVPDANGLDTWMNRLQKGEHTGTSIAQRFFFSDEMTKRNLSNSAYLTALYNTMLGRKPDGEGFGNWLKEMDNGMSRETIFRHFANSREFADICSFYGIKR